MPKTYFNFKPLFTLFATFIFVLFLVSSFTRPALSASGINKFVNFQGKLVNNPAGTNVSNTSYTVIFTIYDKASGGTSLWTETQTVTTTDGIFRVALGSVTAIPANFNFNWSDLYLGMKVNSDAEMTPRVQLAAVPYAFNSQQVAGLTVQDTSGNASTSGTLQIANAKTFNLGTNNLTFTTSGDTTLTLPTSGTVCTTGNCLAFDPYWNQTAGELFPNNSTVDFILGAQSTASARFRVTANAQGAGTLAVASISGRTSFASFVVSNDGVGDLFTASKGGALRFAIAGNGAITASAYATCTLKTDAFGLVTCGTDNTSAGAPSPFSELTGTIVANNSTEDFLFGSQASVSARFRLTANNLGAGTIGVASVSGKTSFATLVVNNDGVGDLFTASQSGWTRFAIKGNGQIFAPAYTAAGCTLKADTTGLVTCGVDNTSAGAPSPFSELTGTIVANNSTEDFLFGSQASVSARFRLTANNLGAGTIGVASVSGKTSFATLVVNNDGVGDLFTASQSGWSKFVITNSGKVGIGTSNPGSAALSVMNGNVGIGTTTPDTALQVKLADTNAQSISTVLSVTHTGNGVSGFTTDTGGTLPNSLVSYFKFDEPSGNSFVDTYGTNNGTATGTTIATGKISNARSYNGTSSDYSSVSSPSNLPLGANIRSVFAWVKRNDTNDAAIVTYGAAAGGMASNLDIISNKAYFSGFSADVTGSTSLSTGIWYLIGYTYDGTNIRVYLNGSLDSAVTAEGLNTSSTDLYFGKDNPQNTFFFNGTIDEVGIWSKVLGAQEITDLYNSGNANTYNAGAAGSGIGAGIAFEDQNMSSVNITSARIAGVLTNATNGAEDGALTFETIKDGGALVERARVDSSGNFAVGTTSATALFEANGTASFGGVLKFRSSITAQVQATADKTLTLGGDTTGQVVLSGFNGAVNGITMSGYNTCTLKTTSAGIVTCGTDNTGAGGSSPFTENTALGMIFENNNTEDLLIGGTTTASAKFAFVNVAGGEATASISGQITLRNGTGNINRLNGGDITFQTSLGGDAGLATKLTIKNNGFVGIGTTSPLSTLDVRAQNGTTPVASFSGRTSFAALLVDNTTGDLITASASGATRFVVAQNGSVGIGGSLANQGYKLDVIGNARIGANAGGNDILKDMSSDFTQAGSTITTNDSVNNVSTTSDQIALITDLIGAGASLTAPANGPSTAQNIGAGALAFQRPDSSFVVVAGGGSAVTKIYDPVTNTFGNGPTMQAPANTGAQAFQKQDGNFVILLGGGTGNTIQYNPGGSNNFGTMKIGPFLAGPTVPPATPAQSLLGAGSQVIRRADGRFLVIMGNSSAVTNLYDPTATSSANSDLGSFSIGPTLTGNVTTGSFAFERTDGRWIIGIGGSATTNIYDPGTNGFSAGPSLAGGATTGAGAHVIQRPDSKYLLILGGNSTATQVYDPATNSWTNSSTPTLTVAAQTGSHSFQRSDGKWVTMVGGASVTTNLYDPTSGANGAYSAGTSLFAGNTAGAGSISFQRPDGKFVVVTGNSAQTSTIYDAGWNTTGTWTSENLTSSNISTYSALLWQSNPQSANNNARLDKSTISVSVKTAATTSGLTNAQWVPLSNSGDLLGATAPMLGAAQIQVAFTAPVRSYPQLVTSNINQSNIWGGEGNTFNRRTLLQPSLYSLRIINPLVQYGGLANDPQFGRSFATAGALLEGVVTDNNNQMTLAINRNLPVSTNSAGFIIASASANIGTNVTTGSFAFSLPNGKTLLGVGGATTTKIYDPDTNIFSAGPTLPNSSGAGAHAIQLANGNFFVILGGGKFTAVYDTAGNVFSAGPTLWATVGAGSSTFQRPDGQFINIAAGNTTLTNLIDPFLMGVAPGPYLTAAGTNGSWGLRRPDGRILVYLGNGTATNMYDAATNAFVVGPVLATTMGTAGSMAIQLSNGRILTLRGANTSTNLLDPLTNLFVAGPANGISPGVGAFAIPRPDGKILIGGATTTTSVYDPHGSAAATSGQFTAVAASPTLPCTVAAGGLVFQRPDGTYLLVCGNSTQNSVIIDAGWNLGGSYISEQISAPNLNTNSALYWQNVGQGNIFVKYRTASSQAALGIATWKDLQYSGANISPASGDAWIQVRFDFAGTLADMPGAKSKVWPGADAGGVVVYNRSVQTPAMSYWKLLNAPTPTILTLTSGSQNIFRFSADGQAYTGAGGAWNTGNADLAERYTSSQTLQPGEVVIGDKTKAQNVVRSTDPYQSNIMGVVSTNPGFVAGSDTPDSYPIALVGRVPVKISTENGPIKSGDYLTSSSIQGYAMKATVAGRVLGTALEDFDPINAENCPKDGAGSLTTTECGTIIAFINLTSYNGESIESLMADKGYTATDSSGLEASGGISSYLNNVSAKDNQVLSFLKSLQNNADSAILNSGIVTGRLSAVNIVSPNIIADLITAKTIRADRIEGLEVFTDKLSSLSNTISSLYISSESGVLASDSAQFVPGALNLQNLNVVGLATISGQLNIKRDTLINGMLTVLSSISSPNLVISEFASFFGDVIFKGNVKFEQPPTFNSDTAGFAVIEKGDTSVEVNFDQEYINTPVVTASISLGKDDDTAKQKALEDSVLNGNLSYIITQRTSKGFVIKLSRKADSDVTFSWVALSINNSKISLSGDQAVLGTNSSATNSAAFKSILNQLK